jgi:SAM-dependent methyltransferase
MAGWYHKTISAFIKNSLLMIPQLHFTLIAGNILDYSIIHCNNLPGNTVNMTLETPLLILLAFFIILFVVYLLWVVIPILSGLPWIPTRPRRIRRALELAHTSPGESFYDLGSGDGRALIIAAREFGMQAVGVEISPIHCIVARINAMYHGISNQVVIKWTNFYKVDLSAAEVIFVYMTSREASRLRYHLENLLHPGTRVITISCEIEGWQPAIFDREALIYIYQIGSHKKS